MTIAVIAREVIDSSGSGSFHSRMSTTHACCNVESETYLETTTPATRVSWSRASGRAMGTRRTRF